MGLQFLFSDSVQNSSILGLRLFILCVLQLSPLPLFSCAVLLPLLQLSSIWYGLVSTAELPNAELLPLLLCCPCHCCCSFASVTSCCQLNPQLKGHSRELSSGLVLKYRGGRTGLTFQLILLVQLGVFEPITENPARNRRSVLSPATALPLQYWSQQSSVRPPREVFALAWWEWLHDHPRAPGLMIGEVQHNLLKQCWLRPLQELNKQLCRFPKESMECSAWPVLAKGSSDGCLSDFLLKAARAGRESLTAANQEVRLPYSSICTHLQEKECERKGVQ